MPIYEYICLKCGHKFESRRSLNDSDSEVQCPKCGEKRVRRAFSVCASLGGKSCASPRFS